MPKNSTNIEKDLPGFIQLINIVRNNLTSYLSKHRVIVDDSTRELSSNHNSSVLIANNNIKVKTPSVQNQKQDSLLQNDKELIPHINVELNEFYKNFTLKSPVFIDKNIQYLIKQLSKLLKYMEHNDEIKKYVQPSSIKILLSNLLTVKANILSYAAQNYTAQYKSKPVKNLLPDSTKKSVKHIYIELLIHNLKPYNRQLLIHGRGGVISNFSCGPNTYPRKDLRALIKHQLSISLNGTGRTQVLRNRNNQSSFDLNYGQEIRSFEKDDKLSEFINYLKPSDLNGFVKNNVISKITFVNNKLTTAKQNHTEKQELYKVIHKFATYDDLRDRTDFRISSVCELTFYKYNGDRKTLIISKVGTSYFKVIDPEDGLIFLLHDKNHLDKYLREYCIYAMQTEYYRYTMHTWQYTPNNCITQLQCKFIWETILTTLRHCHKPILSILLFAGTSIILTYLYSNALLNLLPLAVAAFFTANLPIILFGVTVVLGMIVGWCVWKLGYMIYKCRASNNLPLEAAQANIQLNHNTNVKYISIESGENKFPEKYYLFTNLRKIPGNSNHISSIDNIEQQFDKNNNIKIHNLSITKSNASPNIINL